MPRHAYSPPGSGGGQGVVELAESALPMLPAREAIANRTGERWRARNAAGKDHGATQCNAGHREDGYTNQVVCCQDQELYWYPFFRSEWRAPSLTAISGQFSANISNRIISMARVSRSALRRSDGLMTSTSTLSSSGDFGQSLASENRSGNPRTGSSLVRMRSVPSNPSC